MACGPGGHEGGWLLSSVVAQQLFSWRCLLVQSVQAADCFRFARLHVRRSLPHRGFRLCTFESVAEIMRDEPKKVS